MNVERTATAAFVAVFESEAELEAEHRANLALGALRLPTAESVPLHTTLLVTLRGPGGGEAHVKGTVVATLADGLALAIDGDPEERLARLATEKKSGGDGGNAWDRMRSLSQMEKILLAVKADRAERL